MTESIETVGEERQTDEEHMKAAETTQYNYTPSKHREALWAYSPSRMHWCWNALWVQRGTSKTSWTV